ncbi:MAG: rod shape-determining protein MreD [Sphingobacteriaceae bacterium]
MSRIPIIILRFIVLIFIQVFLLKNVGYYNLSVPFIYILFILLLPFKTPNILLFALAFATGITVDAFYDTLGLHALACTVLAFSRILFISITVPSDQLDSEPEPSMSKMGLRWFLIYGFILTFIHHLTLFTFEIFRLSDFGQTLLRSLLSTFFSLFLILITEFIFYRKKMR